MIRGRRLSARFEGMVKFAAGVIAGAGLSCALASASPVSRHDGAFWKSLGAQGKTHYVDGYSDAMHTSRGKLEQLKIASTLFHWKGAGKILDRIERGMDLSDLPAANLIGYLDDIYSNRQYGDFDIANAIELALMRGADSHAAAQQPAASSAPAASTARR